MRVLMTADPYLPVPPLHYGGIERMVDLLVRGLSKRGHEITLLAHPASTADVELVPYGSPPHWGIVHRARELGQVWSTVARRAARSDVVHSFGRLAALAPILPLRRVPKVQSYSRGALSSLDRLELVARIAGRSLEVVGCSDSVFQNVDERSSIHRRRIFNAVELDLYPFQPEVASDAPLVFLGRLDHEKCPHRAIQISLAAGRRIILAGNIVDDEAGRAYFAREVAPLLDDDRVRYVGPVDDAQKAALLGSAAALVSPIDFHEAFGLNLAEALACGTPAIAFARGAIPEVIRDGVTGFVCRDNEEAVRAVARLGELDRAAARADCEQRFSADAMVDAYEALYVEMQARCASSS